jgi:pimeloyl-ACP methyl ester carboxylesterase
MLAEGTSDRVVSSGLVLVDVAPKTNRGGVERIIRFMQSGANGFGTLDEAATAIAAYTPHRVRNVNTTGLMKVLRPRDGRWYWHWDPTFLDHAPMRIEDVLDVAVSNIHVPTMLVRGMLSDVVTKEGADDILTRMEDVTVVEVDDAAHMIAGDQNDAFSEAVVTFLREKIQPTIR